MRILIVTVFAALLLAAPAQAAETCGLPKDQAHSIAAGAGATLVSDIDYVYGCLPGHRPRHLLILGGSSDRLTSVGRVAGHQVVFDWYNCDRYTGFCSAGGIVTASLRGRGVRRIRVGSQDYVGDMELRPNGALAWTTGTPDGIVKVWRRRACCGTVRLDAGPDIDLYSLDRVGTTISWTRGGVRHSAPLV